MHLIVPSHPTLHVLAVNFYAISAICELVKCSKLSPPPLIASSGWEVYTFGGRPTALTGHWHIGVWSVCVNRSTGVYWGNTSCEMSQTRAVVCHATNGTKLHDDVCIGSDSNKPQFERTCWGACGVQRSCEELDWDSTMDDGEVCGSKTYLGGTNTAQRFKGGHLWAPGWYTEERGLWDAQAWAQTQQHCLDAGSRMCTLEEMMDEAPAWDIGGPTLFWTSTKCPDEVTGDGYWVSPARNDETTLSIVNKGCARPDELHGVACCSEFATTNKSQALLDRRAEASATYGLLARGFSGYCEGYESGSYPCERYDGGCTPDRYTEHGDRGCLGADMCAVAAGSKYGMPKGINVCIPQYHVNQITFQPTKMIKGQPSTFVFTSRGDSNVPENGAIVRIVKGHNPGCMGVWDYTAPVAADSGKLTTQGGWRVRPESAPMPDSCHGVGACADSLPYATEPYLIWEDVMLDQGLVIASVDWEEPTHHVCLCDTDEDCSAAENWHDLGELKLEPAADKFAQMLPHSEMHVAVDGDLLETYGWNDVLAVRAKNPEVGSPSGLVATSDAMNPYGKGAETLFELCSQRCIRNDRCRGFTITTGPVEQVWMHGEWRPALQLTKCALKGEKVKLRRIGVADGNVATYRYYFQKQGAFNDEWHYWPTLNFSSYGVEQSLLRNPSLSGALGPLVGVDSTVVPDRSDSYDVPGVSDERLRALMLMSIPGAYRNDGGDAWESYTGGPNAKNHHNQGYFAGFSYEERGQSGDGKVFAPVVLQQANGDRTPRTRAVALAEGTAAEMLPQGDLSAGATFFAGGIYYARKKPTCGGNSFGLPCIFGTAHPDSIYEPEWNMCSYQGSERPWCYTKQDRSHWGYCDCERDENAWTRPLGWLSTFHNMGPAGGGDVFMNSDDLHHPIVGLLYEARAQATRVKVNGSLCVRSEHYLDVTVGAYFAENGASSNAEMICPDGEVLTGFASTGSYAPAPPRPRFQYFSAHKSYHDAEADCAAAGGHLASLHSVEDVDDVMALAQGDSWIGLERHSLSSAWTWSDGTPFGQDVLAADGRKTLWNTAWGTQGNDGVCARWGWGTSKTWDDVSCGEAKPYTCGFPEGAMPGMSYELSGSQPRCGIPAGYAVATSRRALSARLGDASSGDVVATSDTCDYRAMRCPERSVAVGFKYDTSAPHWAGGDYCGSDVRSMVLLCAPFEMEDSSNFRRLCANADCVDEVGNETTVNSPNECTDLCQETPGCLSVRITDLSEATDFMAAMTSTKQPDHSLQPLAFATPRKCELFKGLCLESSVRPYGRAEASIDYVKPAVFTAVELDHPSSSTALASFAPSRIDANVLVNAKAITWGGTPWTTCSVPCGTGLQYRTVFCAMRTAAQIDEDPEDQVFSLEQQVDDALCARLVKPPEERSCKQYHCDLECRVDETRSRLPCHLYERDTRKDAVDFRTRQQACEQNGCCFVRELSESTRLESDAKHECYAKPWRVYPMWMEMSYDTCSIDGLEAPEPRNMTRLYQESTPPKITLIGQVMQLGTSIGMQSKRNLCVSTEGHLVPSKNCSVEQPPAARQCNNLTIAPICDASGCGQGRCTRRVPQESVKWASWIYTDQCDCYYGHGTPIDATTSARGAPCSVDLAPSMSWRAGTPGECQQVAGVKSSTGFRATQYNCVYGGSSTAIQGGLSSNMPLHSVDQELCGEHERFTLETCALCDCTSMDEYGTVTYCNGEEATIEGYVGKILCDTTSSATLPTWTIPSNLATAVVAQPNFTWQQNFGGLGSDFVLLEHRTTSAVGYTFPASNIATCVATCRGAPNCPGFIFRSGSCMILDPFRMTLNPINRGVNHPFEEHLVVRIGFLYTEMPSETLLAAVTGASAWSEEIGNKVIEENRRISKLTARIPEDDVLWDWIESTTTQQGVALKKSFYSLSFPVHPHVSKHLRFLKNYFNSSRGAQLGDINRMADLMLATAMKYRYLPSVTNSTTTGAYNSKTAQRMEGNIDGVPSECKRYLSADEKWTGAYDSDGGVHFPLKRHPNPSPIAALDTLIEKELEHGFNDPKRVDGDSTWHASTRARAPRTHSECIHCATRLYHRFSCATRRLTHSARALLPCVFPALFCSVPYT